MSMTAVAPTTKRGNPNLGKKQETDSIKSTKLTVPEKGFFEFVLAIDYEKQKPVDKLTGALLDNPFPDIYIVPNAGVAYNEATGSFETWRYLYGYNSIWEKDQQFPKPDKSRLSNVDGKNDIMFRQGRIKVMPNDEAKYWALIVQDECADCENPRNEAVVPKYKLVDEDKALNAAYDVAEETYLAEKYARECTDGEMIPVAQALGLNTNKIDNKDQLFTLRKHFVLKAKAFPKLFLRAYNEPGNRIKYLVGQAIATGVTAMDGGALKYTESGRQVLSLDPDMDIAEQVAILAMNNDEDALAFIKELKGLSL